MEYVKRQFKQTGDAANDSALKVQQSFTRQESAAKKAGIPVGQYNAAMRMLPAQFTDIATQLAGGQSPWLILLQQGGQVKDSFGGIIPTFRALLGTISPVMVGVGALAAATGAVFYAWYQGSSTLSDFNKTLVLSGNTAGLTSNRMLVLAKSGEQAGLTFNQTSSALTELVNAGVRAGARFDEMSQAVAKFTDASGVPVDKVAAAFGKLTNDPTSGLIAMAQQFHNVTAEQIAYVAQLQRAGDEAGALQAANDAATNGFREQTKSLRDNMGSIESAADSLKRAFKSMWDAALDIGRPDTTQEMVAKAEAAFKRADEIWNLRKGDGYVNDDARASYWNDRESARLALEMAQQQASVAKATEDNAAREAVIESDRQKYAVQAQSNYAKTQTALEKYTARQNELNKALKDGRILQADYNINLEAAKKEYDDSLKKPKAPSAVKTPAGVKSVDTASAQTLELLTAPGPHLTGRPLLVETMGVGLQLFLGGLHQQEDIAPDCRLVSLPQGPTLGPTESYILWAMPDFTGCSDLILSLETLLLTYGTNPGQTGRDRTCSPRMRRQTVISKKIFNTGTGKTVSTVSCSGYRRCLSIRDRIRSALALLPRI